MSDHEAGYSADDTSQGDGTSVKEELYRARRALLDLTARNRLLSTPRHKARGKTLEVVDELSDEVYRILIDESRRMSFLAKPEDSDDDGGSSDDEDELGQPEDDEQGIDERGIALRHADNKLQTTLRDTKLQSKLLSLFYDARTAEEEQGVNVLYLALGFLRWFEDDKSDIARHAPLLLIPCELTRRSVGGRIHLSARDDEISTNLSLKERLDSDFGITLPDVPEGVDFVPSQYFGTVRSAVESRARFEILENDIVLGFFSFSKFLMYRDLNAGTWPTESAIDGHPILQALLGGGFAALEPLWPEGGRIDDHVAPKDMVHVMDADSSQVEAIEEVKAGRSLVIQGPPGTGKSQTITNLIAAAVMQGKSVLFVAEKLAALEVVRHRMEGIGLGQICLELHSRKAHKKSVLDELGRALTARSPRLRGKQVERLADCRRKLNDHADTLHTTLKPCGLTPYRILGEMVRHVERGTPSPRFDLQEALDWTQKDFQARRVVTQRLARLVDEAGPLSEHPWFGATLTVVLPTDLQRVRTGVDALKAVVDELLGVSEEIRQRLGCGPETLADAPHWQQLTTLLKERPDFDGSALDGSSWSGDRGSMRELVEDGQAYVARRSEAGDVFQEEAWTWSAESTRSELKKHERSWFRLLRRDYRCARDQFRRMAANPPKGVTSWILALDALIEAQALRQRIDGLEPAGSGAFGTRWNGSTSDWALLASSLDWCESVVEMTQSSALDGLRSEAQVQDAVALTGRVEALCRDVQRLFSNVRDAVQLDVTSAFSVDDVCAIPIQTVAERVAHWASDVERLAEWTRLWRTMAEARDLHLEVFVDALQEVVGSASQLADEFEYAYYEAWVRETLRRHPHLEMFEGRVHDEIVAEFRSLDRERIELARLEVARAHYLALPKGEGQVGELGVVRREVKKKRRHLPIRKLLLKAGTAIQKIKPVFMMSPLSVAQYLAPGRIEFDLLVMDEASQIEPVDALGAMLRARQIVVVGDEKQLPPTAFFSRLAIDEDDDQSEVSDIESILGVCAAQGLPGRMLNWHYRSQHQSLIAVSNRHFYGNRLYVVPSPFARSRVLGLKFHHVKDGVYDRGGRRDNRIEARRVAQAVIEHARDYPEETLGIGTFSMAQRDAIRHELERLWRNEPDTKGFFATNGQEPFFVKNLENIQGDERDVIFISVGYGPDENGYPKTHASFGPLNRDGGERRLNVLITRARRRCVVFSSITDADIDLARTQSLGVRALKEFLAYAATGTFSVPESFGDDFESPFEEQVARAIEAHGYDVVPQVGLAGFRIDLAIPDPQKPGRFLLGIECDGAAYHSSRAARDRDRIRQQVLEARGWRIHRIWSTDWFKHRDEQMRKVLAAIEAARDVETCVEPDPVGLEADPQSARVRGADPLSQPEPEPVFDACAPDAQLTATRYRTASFDVDSSRPIHETPLRQLVEVVCEVTQIEGPVRADVIARRVTTLWGLKRTGDRITAAVKEALDLAARRDRLSVFDGDYYAPIDGGDISVRDRTNAPSEVRRPENLPPAEIRTAVLHVVDLHAAAARDEIVRQVARMLGFRSTSAQVAAAITTELDVLDGCTLVERDGRYSRK